MRRRVTIAAAIATLLVAGLVAGLRVRDATRATIADALRAYPIYAFVRTRDLTLAGAAAAGWPGGNLLIPRDRLAGPADTGVTTPNNDTLYAFAFLDLVGGPVLLRAPALPRRYHSIALMDARTDHTLLTGTRDGGPGGLWWLRAAGDRTPPPPGARVAEVSTRQAWLLIRVLVLNDADQPAAAHALRLFRLEVPPASRRAPRQYHALPVLPDAATLIATVDPVLAENPTLGPPIAWASLPAWRRWLWTRVLPRVWRGLEEGIAAGGASPDGWSRTPPGIGTAAASSQVRAAVALGGLGALPATEAIYWRAIRDASGAPLTGTRRYRLTLPATIPAQGFWSVSMYRLLPDGRLFYAANPIGRHAVGDRTPGLARAADASVTLTIAHCRPVDAANWLPAPAGAFNLVFRAYLPEPEIADGRFRLQPVTPAES